MTVENSGVTFICDKCHFKISVSPSRFLFVSVPKWAGPVAWLCRVLCAIDERIRRPDHQPENAAAIFDKSEFSDAIRRAENRERMFRNLDR